MSNARYRRLATVFRRERERFAAEYPHVIDASLEIDGNFKADKARDYATADSRTLVVTVRPAIVHLADGNILALIRHELAHLCDGDLSERDTDALAERVSGEKIFYDERDIQTVTSGVRPRPKRLPK